MLRLKFGGYVRPLRPEPLEELAQTLGDLDFCYAVLNKVSRSFAVVIQQLPVQLQDPVCIFYLVLRGLDSVEDDMTYDPKPKVVLLRAFHEKLSTADWNIENVGDSPDYRILLKYFHKVINVFAAMEPQYQAVIVDITRRMGHGMAEYVNEETSTETIADYNQYCHYVAGLVGHGLSALFSASKLESPELGIAAEINPTANISNSMGLFLQKTNIIRDYLEDLQDKRTWWPREIWSKYVPSLNALATAPTAPLHLACLNHMVTDALSLVPSCLEYLALIKDPKIFEFCAIPQVMAMATLELCYNNPAILARTSVKIRKGMSCKMMLNASNLDQVHGWFNAFARRLEARIPDSDPSSKRTRELIAITKEQTDARCSRMLLGPKILTPRFFNLTHRLAWSTIFIGAAYLAVRCGCARLPGAAAGALEVMPRGAVDAALAVGSTISVGFLGGFFGMQFV